ncbi:MAG: CDP-alcohol phosphatidyltransferase family protein [Acidiferrobacterales bacterium]|nr:CDP-alcohol phosphatidyltransferase family protein [Acidiferrobacterales bacterium]
MKQPNHTEARRPLKVRDASFAQRIARWLANNDIQPNHISLFSIVFGVIAAGCLLMIAHTNLAWLWAILAAVAIQGRLLCNLFDGMVAIEGGKSAASGELFNDIPDRIVDPIILIALGYAATQFEFNALLGWLAGVLAVFTAYVRTLAASIGAPIDFSGPMAKQHRMAIITIASILFAIEFFVWGTSWSLSLALYIVVAGCVLTIANRVRNAYRFLESTENTNYQPTEQEA